MNKGIIKFLHSRHTMTLSTVGEGAKPWCCTLFYAFYQKGGVLLFSSDSVTRHMKEVGENPCVAVAISSISRVISSIKGVQITGVVRPADELKEEYLRRFPVARLHPQRVWAVEIETLKFTNNSLGFGHKEYYEKL